MRNNTEKYNIFHNLFDLISMYQNANCDFVIHTKEYHDLDKTFKSFFAKNFTYEKIQKLYYKCFIYQNYIIKFNNWKIPEEIINTTEMVHTYFRQNFKFVYQNKVMYLGVEIQDFLDNAQIAKENDLYQLYKSLRQKGLIWMDANIGNAVIYKNKPIIVDKDYIYNEKEANYLNQSLLSKEFEERYKNTL